MAGNDYIFRKCMETSESAVPDSGKDNIDLESHKKIGGRRNASLISASRYHRRIQ